MSAHVLLNLLNELGKKIRCKVLPSQRTPKIRLCQYFCPSPRRFLLLGLVNMFGQGPFPGTLGITGF